MELQSPKSRAVLIATLFAEEMLVCVGELDTNGVAVGVGRRVFDDWLTRADDVETDPVELEEPEAPSLLL